ncbi:hypothetical protein MRX96_031383 [Rhipicephalus microplus]
MAPERAITFDSTADTAYCVLVTAKTRCGMDEIISRTAAAEIRTPIFELAVVSNLMAKGIKNGFVTLSWQRPHGRFDYCSIEAFEDKAAENLSFCEEHVTAQTWLNFNSTPDTPYCVLVSANTTCGIDKISSQPAVAESRTPIFELAEVSNLLAYAIRTGYVVLSWQRPQSRFDYYSVEAFVKDVGWKRIDTHKLGLCANGTIVHRDQTHVTCGPFEPCTTLSFVVRTHLTGQPERVSSGVTVKDIFIRAEEPHPPKDISISSVSPSVSRLQWDHPDKGTAVPVSYNVTICRTFRTCGRERNLGDCREEVTERMSVMFNSTQDTPYCVLVTAKRRCGIDEIRGWPAVATLRTPVLVPPDVTNLRVVRVGADFFIAAWERPKISFDFYSVEVTSTTNRSRTGVAQDAVGSCVRGTIIHRDRTHVVCSQLPPCVNVRFTTAGYGNSFLTNAAVAVRNLTVSYVGDDNFTLTWQKPEGCVDNYTVMVTENSARIRVLCANATISVKPNVRGAANDTLSGETLSGVLLPGKHPPPVRDLQLSAITHRYFEITYKAPKECYSDFDHYIFHGPTAIPKLG